MAETEACDLRLEDLRDIHKGERCFIIGTGPSLNKTNMGLLKDETLFGVNTLYRGLPQWGLRCRYYAVGDVRVWNEQHENILEQDCIFFLSEEISNTYPDTIDHGKCFVIRTLPSMWVVKRFSGDLTVGKLSGDNVIIDCLQECFYLGFDKVYLLGCDCTSTGHFMREESDKLGMFEESGGYHAFSDDWRTRFARSFESYRVCKVAYEQAGREVINCTKGGNLEVFKRMSLEKVVNDGVAAV